MKVARAGPIICMHFYDLTSFVSKRTGGQAGLEGSDVLVPPLKEEGVYPKVLGYNYRLGTPLVWSVPIVVH